MKEKIDVSTTLLTKHRSYLNLISFSANASFCSKIWSRIPHFLFVIDKKEKRKLWGYNCCCSTALSHVWLFVTHQASLSFTVSRNLFRLMFIESVMPSNHLILCHPLLLLPSIFPSIGVFFPVNLLFASGGQSIGDSASASVLPMSVQCLFPLGLTGLISLPSKGLSRIFSSTTILKQQFLSLYGWSFTSIHDYWRNHSFDYMDLCQQSDIFAF